jgi:hypothetical protein
MLASFPTSSGAEAAFAAGTFHTVRGSPQIIARPILLLGNVISRKSTKLSRKDSTVIDTNVEKTVSVWK